MPKYRKKPIEIEAIQWDGTNLHECLEFIDFNMNWAIDGVHIPIDTKEGRMIADIGDYLIKELFDKERGFYPCKPNIFEQTYEEVK